MTTKADVEHLMRGVVPYLTIKGAEAGVEFYQRAFGAVLHGDIAKGPDGRVMNATLLINGGAYMVMDPFVERGSPPDGVSSNGMMMIILTLEADMWWARAVAAGCTVVMPIKMEFWGDRFGMLRDPFGIQWGILEPADKAA
jgi:PhnB protein